MDYYKENLKVLKKVNEKLYNEIVKLIIAEENYKIIKTRQENYTIQVVSSGEGRKSVTLLHSKYNPEKEAIQFADKQFNNKAKINLVYGFGLGYHIEEILKKLDSTDLLYVMDINIEVFKLALKLKNLQRILLDKRLKLIISKSQEEIVNKMKKILQKENKLVIYVPSLKTIPNKYEKFKIVMEEWNMKKSYDGEWDEKLKENRHNNNVLNSESIGKMINKYKNKPIIIVSAGPSLNKNKHLLKDLKGKALIFAVGSALKPLLRCGVSPDMFCIIDPSPITYKQIEGYENLDIPFIYLDTASSYTVSKYNGPKYVISNKGNGLNSSKELIEMGGSVATAVMDMAIRFGGNPIVFVGQDLAYVGNRHHADGDMYGAGEVVKSLPNMRKVKGQNGELLDTTLGLLSFKRWIENKIKDTVDVEFINATEGGALIEGCKNMKLSEFIEGRKFENLY